MDSAQIKSLALELGFAKVGIAPAGPIAHTESLRRWLVMGMNAGMGYMTANLPLRFAPCLLVPDARSVIVLALSYAPAQGAMTDKGGIIARYARGRDYHKVLKDRCRVLINRIRKLQPDFEGRAFVDSAPVMERSLAVMAGLGGIGRNGCLIVPGLGSYVVLCEIICNLQLDPDHPLAGRENLCSGCGACTAACPTGALHDGGMLDCNRCISYLTIEHRSAIDPRLHRAIGRRIFGCDACQECCPHNRNVPAGNAKLLGEPLESLDPQQVLSWDQQRWDEMTRGRAIRRASLEMWQRNAAIVAANI